MIFAVLVQPPHKHLRVDYLFKTFLFYHGRGLTNVLRRMTHRQSDCNIENVLLSEVALKFPVCLNCNRPKMNILLVSVSLVERGKSMTFIWIWSKEVLIAVPERPPANFNEKNEV